MNFSDPLWEDVIQAAEVAGKYFPNAEIALDLYQDPETGERHPLLYIQLPQDQLDTNYPIFCLALPKYLYNEDLFKRLDGAIRQVWLVRAKRRTISAKLQSDVG